MQLLDSFVFRRRKRKEATMNLLLLLLESIVILTASDWVNFSVNGEAIAEPEALAEAYPKRLVARTTRRLIARKQVNRSLILGAVAPSRNVLRLDVRKDMARPGRRTTTIRRLGQKRMTTRRRGSRRTTKSLIAISQTHTTTSSIRFKGYIPSDPHYPSGPHLPSAPISFPTGFTFDTTPLYPDYSLHPDFMNTPRPVNTFRSALQNIAATLINSGLVALGSSVDAATRALSDKIYYSSSAGLNGGQYPGTGNFDPNFNFGTNTPPNLDPSGFNTTAPNNFSLSVFPEGTILKPNPNLEVFNISALLDKAEQGKGEEALRELLQQIQAKVNDLKEKISNKDGTSIGLEQTKIDALQGILNTIQENLNKASEISNPSSTEGIMSMETTLGTEGTESTTQIDYGDFLDF